MRAPVARSSPGVRTSTRQGGSGLRAGVPSARGAPSAAELPLAALELQSLPELLGAVDAGTGERILGRLQAAGGNAAVQRRIDMGTRDENFDVAIAALKPKPPPGPEEQKGILQQIRDINREILVDDLDELKLGRLWSSFGPSLPAIYDDNKEEWDLSRERGMDLTDIGILNLAVGELGGEVKGIAQEYLTKNMQDALSAEKELGFKEVGESMWEAGETGAIRVTDREVERRQEVAFAAVQLQELRKVQQAIESQWVGYYEVKGSALDKEGLAPEGAHYAQQFVPGRPPQFPWDDPTGEPPLRGGNVVPYEDVYAEWKAVTGALLALADEHPVLYAALKEDQLGQVAGETMGDNPIGAMRQILAGLKGSIAGTKENINSGDIDWQELKPIHRQLLEGERTGRHPWSHPVYKAAAKEKIGNYETAQTVADVGIGIASAVMFLFSAAASGGASALFLLGGLGLSGANVARKWKDYDELKEAAQSAASSRQELVGKDQVDTAYLDAVLESAFFALDLWGAGKTAVQTIGKTTAKRVGAKEAATKGVEELAQQVAKGAASDTAGRALIEKSIIEDGVEKTMQRLGVTDPKELAKYLGSESKAAARIAEYTEVAARLGKNVDLMKVLENISEETTKRDLGELDAIVRLAIERYGPRAVLQKADGWKHLSSALGGNSSAGKLLMAWRDSIYEGLKRFIKAEARVVDDEQVKNLIKDTGSKGDFTNDLDMSFLGKDAAALRSKGLQYLAGRSGLPADAARLDKLLYIGLFTDPRRLHMYDKFPDLAGDLSTKTAAFEEQLIWNAELARVSLNIPRRMRVLQAMDELGIKEIPNFKPLHERSVTVLSTRQDQLVGEIEQLMAKEPPDKAALSERMVELANVQAQINVKEHGGYFSGGGVRRFVTEDPKSPFPGYGPGEAPAKPPAMEHGAALDQVQKLREASDKLALAIGHGAEGMADIAGSIKSIAKYGDRFAEAAEAVGLKIDTARFDAMAAEFRRILAMARPNAAGDTLQGVLRRDYDKLMGDVNAVLVQFDEIHVAVLKELRVRAGIAGKDVVAADIVQATLNRYRWMVFKSNLLHQAAELGRLISEGTDIPETAGGPDAPDVPASTAPMSPVMP